MYLFYIEVYVFCTPQAIIQGLKESGVFSSVIASASTTLSKEKFLATIDSSNSSRATASISHPSRKISRSSESMATARKTLDVEVAEFQELAVPPLSPPAMDDNQLSFEV